MADRILSSGVLEAIGDDRDGEKTQNQVAIFVVAVLLISDLLFPMRRTTLLQECHLASYRGDNIFG